MATLNQVWNLVNFNDELRRRCEAAMWVAASQILIANGTGMDADKQKLWARAVLFDKGDMTTAMMRCLSGVNVALTDVQIRSMIDTLVLDSLTAIYPGFANGDD